MLNLSNTDASWGYKSNLNSSIYFDSSKKKHVKNLNIDKNRVLHVGCYIT